MNKDIEMKKHILELISQMLMGEHGSKFKPKAVSVEMMGEPKLMEIDEDEPMEHEMMETPEEEMMEHEDEEDKPKMSLKEFLANKA